MKITTLNLQGFDAWETRKEQITTYLEAMQPDVILFQEVVYLPDISPHSQIHSLNQSLEYSFEYNDVTRLQVGVDYPVYREGLGILSKYPAIKTETLVLQQAMGDEHHRIVQLIDLAVHGTVIKLANVHFSLTDTVDYASAHLQELLTILEARNEVRIIAGDFNINDIEALSDMWSHQYRASASTSYVSFPSQNKRVDYILIPREHSFESISTSGDGLSDHRAITADIRLGA